MEERQQSGRLMNEQSGLSLKKEKQKNKNNHKTDTDLRSVSALQEKKKKISSDSKNGHRFFNSTTFTPNTCDVCEDESRGSSSTSVFSPRCMCEFLHFCLFSFLLSPGVALRAIFFFFSGGGSYQAFLTALNGTMEPAYRRDSCFIEPVYNVC